MTTKTCDLCGKNCGTLKDIYDEDGYGTISTIQIMKNRKYNNELDVCNECLEKIIGFVKKEIKKGAQNEQL